MAPTQVAVSTPVAGTTTATPAAPTHVAGDSILIYAASKPGSTVLTAPSGWTKVIDAALGTGTDGLDTGTVRLTVLLQDNVAAGTTMPAVGAPLTGTAAGIVVAAASYRPGAGETLVGNYAYATGSDTTSGTGYSVTAGSNPAMAAPDLWIVPSVISNDAALHSAQNASSSGTAVSSVTEHFDFGTANGNDLLLALHTVNYTGSAGLAPSFTATLAAASYGGCGFIRVRATTVPVTLQKATRRNRARFRASLW